jgi:hypothetical protein
MKFLIRNLASRTISIPDIMGFDGACGWLLDPEAPEEISSGSTGLDRKVAFVKC